MKKVKETFWNNEDISKALDKESKKSGVPKSEIIRRALKKYLKIK